MRIISRKALKDFWRLHPDAEHSLRAWFQDVKHADWRTPADVKTAYRNVSVVGRDRLVFNIKGNDYRLVAAVNYAYRIVYIRFVGTHEAYDEIDVRTV
ncbi:MAG: type II toxin-antitoxin system HigB family toxin [Nitrospirae bacterium]|nr:type II toxin-antitoxin system HigB family toxin [Nitrospirota bacterium]MBI3394003.1 type II toxin-antitoxin system HigB family toxin [Nitrospirota bacterium]